MASGLQCGATGVVDSTNAPASSVVTTNVRVKSAAGYVGTVADIVQFSGPSIMGNWISPATRCTVGGVPAINSTSTGIAYKPGPSGLVPGPMRLSVPDTHASGM